MIKINTEKINNWDEIKKNHHEYFEKILKSELSNLYVENNIYIKRRKIDNSTNYKEHYKLSDIQRTEIENIFGGVFSEKNSIGKFTINNHQKIRDIVCGKLEDIIATFDNNSFDTTLIERIFNYDKFCNDNDWNRHTLISMLGISVCPYCNRQYISTYKNYINDETKTTADLDHFYSQSDYAFLALSLYNFIPSCQICNSRFKLKKNFRVIPHCYPYEDEFSEDAKFKLQGDPAEYLLGNSTKFEIVIKPVKGCNNEEKIRNSIETFHIDDIYKIHTDYVQEIIQKSRMYDDTRINELMTNFNDLFPFKNELYRTIFGNYIINEDLGKRPLAKLTKDICEDLGLKFK